MGAVGENYLLDNLKSIVERRSVHSFSNCRIRTCLGSIFRKTLFLLFAKNAVPIKKVIACLERL